MNQRSLLNRRHTQPSFDVIQPFLNLPSLFSSTFKNLFCTWLSNSIFRTRWRWRCTTGVGCSNYSYVDDGGRTMLVDWVSIRVLYGLSWVRSVASADKNPNRFNLNTSFPFPFPSPSPTIDAILPSSVNPDKKSLVIWDLSQPTPLQNLEKPRH